MPAQPVRRASVGGVVFVLGISSPLSLHPFWALCLLPLVALAWSRLERLRPQMLFLGLAGCVFLGAGLIDKVPALAAVALVWGAAASVQSGDGCWRPLGFALIVPALAALTVQVAQTQDDSRAAARPWVQGGEVLAARDGGSMALALGPDELAYAHLELLLPSGVQFFSDPDESASLGVKGALDALGLAAFLQEQLRASAPQRTDLDLWLGAARRAEALSLARVETREPARRSEAPEGAQLLARKETAPAQRSRDRPIKVLRFTSGRASLTDAWRFACPGQPVGKGARPPTRRISVDASQALCPSKYAAPLVAAMGTHSAIPGAAEGKGPASWGWPSLVDRLGLPRVAARVLNAGSLLVLAFWLALWRFRSGNASREPSAASWLGLVSAILLVSLCFAAAATCGWSPDAGGGNWVLGPAEWLWRAGVCDRSSTLEAALGILALWISLGAMAALIQVWHMEARGTRAQGEEPSPQSRADVSVGPGGR